MTRAYTQPDRPEKAQIRHEWLTEVGTEGLIALAGFAEGEVGQALLAGHEEVAREKAQAWAALFPEAFYLEVQRTRESDEPLVQALADLASDLALPLVATHPVQFLRREDFQAHEARVCIAEGRTLADPRREHRFVDEQYFKTQAEMAARFDDLPEALENTVEIARRCNLELTLGKNFLPQFPTPPGMTLDDFLRAQTQEGLEKRLMQLFPDEAVRAQKRPAYDERLAFELKTIVQMGFPGYFLIVADFINWGKHHDVPVGPGRGSGAGSLVAFCLGITDLDPLPYNLLFERFLNPERVSMPDFDVDFCQDGRGRVIDYVRHKYGLEAVSQIATFGTLSSKAVIRDVGRVLDMPYALCDRLSKLIPIEKAKPMKLADALKQEPQFAQLMSDERDGEAVRQLFELAFRLEDLTRNVGMHAGGVVIAPGKISDFCPMYLATGSEASPVSQFDKGDVEDIGLVKFDFLGLRNLTTIELALKYVQQLTGSRPDLLADGFMDSATYRLLQRADTTAIFQLESEGMKKYLKQLKPDCFEDIIAILALYRPGPMDMIPSFIARKHGEEAVDYPDPRVEGMLKETYGVIVYQEQVMQMAQIIANYSLGGADLLRRAMGKKKQSEMDKHREIFAEGAAQNGLTRAKADEIFDLMDKFANYGFNKSHAAAYAVVTYQTAWLKAHHPAAFMAATLSSDMDNTDSVKIFHDDALACGLQILGPDINASGWCFEPVDAKTIRYGLGAVKGVGGNAIDCVVKARQEKPFSDLFDFARRVDKRQVNRRAIEALVKAGAFDTLNPDRGSLFASVELAITAAEQAERNANQGGLFDATPDIRPTLQYVKKPWQRREALMQEKQALGFFFSGHPFEEFRAEARRFGARSLAGLEASWDPVLVAGMVSGIRTVIDKKGVKKLLVYLEDGLATVEISIIFDRLSEAERQKIVVDELLFIRVKIRPHFEDASAVSLSAKDFKNSKVIQSPDDPEDLMSLADMRAGQVDHLLLKPGAPIDLADLKTRLAAFAGKIPVRLAYAGKTAACELALGPKYQVRLDNALLDGLRDWLGKENVVLS
jgi:DNA polymerase-3 subunit alpha